ncbi:MULTISPECIES: hypothetical protein [Pantoea]|uniref:hypothetical protein n=1 Tax=Pantoea TaxID=53335 RepID=UPI001C05F011|nr:hypothetical protein [Pantoea bituminis]
MKKSRFTEAQIVFAVKQAELEQESSLEEADCRPKPRHKPRRVPLQLRATWQFQC